MSDDTPTDATDADDTPTDADPVDLLLRSARDEAAADEFHVTGVMMQYYAVCKRELWFVTDEP